MQAIILKKNIFSEGNEIITMYTRDLGKVRAVARSVKSPKSRLSFGLQSLFHTDVDFLPSHKLATITGVKPIDTFKNIYTDSEKINLALYAAEIVIKSTPDEQSNAELFDLLLDFLQHLNNSVSSKHPCADLFAIKALAANGYALDFEKCVVCSQELVSTTNLGFSNRKNGFLCSNCVVAVGDATPIGHEIYKALAEGRDGNFDQIDTSSIDLKNLHRLTNSFAEHILERNLNSGAYLGKI